MVFGKKYYHFHEKVLSFYRESTIVLGETSCCLYKVLLIRYIE